MKHTKKITAFLLSAAMTFTPVMTPVYAVDTEEPVVTDEADQEWVAMTLRSLPDKLYYHIGEELDLTGATASASGHVPKGMEWDTFDQPITSRYFDVNTSEFDNTKPGTYNIYVSKRGAEDETVVRGTSFEVTVLADGEEAPAPTEKNPDEYLWLNIMTMPKTHYQVGEKLDLTGGTAEVSHNVGDDSNAVIKPLAELHVNTSEFDSTQPGIYNIYVTAKEGSLTATEVFTVTVEDKSEEETIAETATTLPTTGAAHEDITFYITKTPDKTDYMIGEALDLTGGAAFAGGTYYDGTGNVMNWDAFEQPMTYYVLDDSEFDNTKPGTYTIKLTCNGQLESKTVSFTVRVVDEPTTLQPTTDPTEFSRYDGLFFHAPKKRWYKIGDAVDMTGAYVTLGDETKIPVTDPRITVDASGFDNTKPGVYTVYMTFTEGSYQRTEDFLFMVMNADGTAPDGYPEPTGTDNPYNPTGVPMSTAPTVPATDGVTFDRLGDVDANGETDIMDVIKINKCLLGASELTGLARLAADMNRNGRIDPDDAIAALKKSLGMVWQDAEEPVTDAVSDPTVVPTTEFYDPTGNCKIDPPTEDPTEPTTYYIDPTDHCKEWPTEEDTEPITLPTGAGDTQPAQISEHFYGADVSKGPASDGVNPPRIAVDIDTRTSGSLIGIYGYEFYKTNNLITIVMTETSGSYELTVDDVVVDADGNYVVKITRSMPQIATCDLARWYLRVKTDKGCTDPAKVKLDITEKHI